MRWPMSFHTGLSSLVLLGLAFICCAVGYKREAVMTKDAIDRQFEPLLRRSQSYQAFIGEVINDQVFQNISKNVRFLDSCVQYASSKSPSVCAFGILSLSLSDEGKKDALRCLFNYMIANKSSQQYDVLLLETLRLSSMQDLFISDYSTLAVIPDAECAAVMATKILATTAGKLAELGLLEKNPTPLSAFLVENLFTEARKTGKKVPNGERLLVSLANQSIIGKVIYITYGELDENNVLLDKYKLFMEDKKAPFIYKMSIAMHRETDVRSGKLPLETLSISAEEKAALLSLAGK